MEKVQVVVSKSISTHIMYTLKMFCYIVKFKSGTDETKAVSEMHSFCVL